MKLDKILLISVIVFGIIAIINFITFFFTRDIIYLKLGITFLSAEGMFLFLKQIHNEIKSRKKS